jgi:hypothetical protein
MPDFINGAVVADRPQAARRAVGGFRPLDGKTVIFAFRCLLLAVSHLGYLSLRMSGTGTKSSCGPGKQRGGRISPEQGEELGENARRSASGVAYGSRAIRKESLSWR